MGQGHSRQVRPAAGQQGRPQVARRRDQRDRRVQAVGHLVAFRRPVGAGRAARIDQADRRGRVRGRFSNMTQAQLDALNVGVYSSSAQIFSATFSFQFGADR